MKRASALKPACTTTSLGHRATETGGRLLQIASAIAARSFLLARNHADALAIAPPRRLAPTTPCPRNLHHQEIVRTHALSSPEFQTTTAPRSSSQVKERCSVGVDNSTRSAAPWARHILERRTAHASSRTRGRLASRAVRHGKAKGKGLRSRAPARRSCSRGDSAEEVPVRMPERSS